MRPVSELLDVDSPAWPKLHAQLRSAKNGCDVLPRVPNRAESVLQFLQVTTRSTLGAVAFETGGLLIDSGWVRVLASGCDRMDADLKGWNAEYPAGVQNALIVAYDVLGGVFALDGGAFGDGRGGAYYFAPDSLAWESLDRGYSDLLAFFLEGDLERFYGNDRWPTWREDLRTLSPLEGFSHYPPLFTKEGRQAGVSRRPISMMELFGFELDIAKQLDSK